ncbi:hypothetical protein [Streptomyces acidicola]|uniref:Uncharacterized protein n=1 Tax=Streptomyces acidicola TaxID=2596892 RepID=A0A5N8WNI4_9ACTN|nr:hypothetical protein [Streptomyces acidicola]MPY49000.1 hypothetical protein [Streptomyces acidicola]
MTGFLAWITAPLDFLGDLLLMPFRGLLWPCRSKEKRRQEKRLNDGWDSAAGGLGTAVYVWRGDRVLAVGERWVSPLYVREREVEIAWSIPRDTDSHHGPARPGNAASVRARHRRAGGSLTPER